MQTKAGVALDREIRRRKLKHADLEERLGYTPGSGMVCRLISGERKATLEVALTIKADFRIPVEWWTIPADLPATGTDG